jgi:hypothetical protein
MEVNKLLLSFTGTKAELHTQLKKWCEQNGQSMNITVLELIEKHLKKSK